MIGIYKIKNLKNNKIYIGSSNNIEKRINEHFRNLKNNKHPNKHLQLSYNKYGKENFTYEILETFEEIERSVLFNIEADYLENENIDNLYNLTLITNSGGFEILCKKSYLLDLRGNIIKEFNSLIGISKFLNSKQVPTRIINTHFTLKNKYRVVTQEFYDNNFEIISNWLPYKALKDMFNAYYKFDKEINKWIVFNNDEIVTKTDDEKVAINVSKHLVYLINKKLI